jgi:hypothetical protein
MTEQEWLVSIDPEAMLKATGDVLETRYPLGPQTARKRECFGLACCRLLWPLIVQDDLLRRALETLENEFDMPQSEREKNHELWEDMKAAYRHPEDDAPWFKMMAADVLACCGSPHDVVALLIRCFEEWEGSRALPAQVSHIMRDIIGNPFRNPSANRSWLTSDVLLLARGIYDDRAFDRMPILADALQDAGCDSDDILNHCRDPHATHVRSCWVVDAVLGKS